MAVVIIQDFPEEETERSTANYDEISRRLEASGAIPPEGCHLHCSGWTGQRLPDHRDLGHPRAVRPLPRRTMLMPLVMEIAGRRPAGAGDHLVRAAQPDDGVARAVTARAPRNPAFAETVRASFAAQAFMATLGATLGRVEAGEVEIELPYSAALLQQHGYLHAGAVTAVLDSACGYAASTLMAAEQGGADHGVLRAPAGAGGRRALPGHRARRAGRPHAHGLRGRVRQPRRARARPLATMTGTLMAVSRVPGGTPWLAPRQRPEAGPRFAARRSSLRPCRKS